MKHLLAVLFALAACASGQTFGPLCASIAADGQVLAWNAALSCWAPQTPTWRFDGATGTISTPLSAYASTVSSDTTIIQSFGYRPAGSYVALAEIRTQQTVTNSGNEIGRGTYRLYDRIAGRTVEIGCYQYGCGVFQTGGSGLDPMENWNTPAGIFSFRGGVTGNRLEVRTASDAPGINLETGYLHQAVTPGGFGGHIYYDQPGYSLFVHTADGTGYRINPGGTMDIGGQMLPVASLSPTVSVLAGDGGTTSSIALGKWSASGGKLNLFWWQMGDRIAKLGYGVNSLDATKAMVMTDGGRFGIGLGLATTMARWHVKSIETAVPTEILEAAVGQTAPIQVWRAGGLDVGSMSAAGVLGSSPAGVLQSGARASDPGCTVTGDLGRFWIDGAADSHFKTCMNVAGTPAWVVIQ